MAGIIGLIIFLALSAIIHVIFPERTDKLFHIPKFVRMAGFFLIVLGAFCFTLPDIYGKTIGLLVFLSGIARLFVPNKMIKINEWTSRYGHAILMFSGSAICLMYYLFVAT